MNYKHVFQMPMKIYGIGGALFWATSYEQMVALRKKLAVDFEIFDVTEKLKDCFKDKTILNMEPVHFGEMQGNEVCSMALYDTSVALEPDYNSRFFKKFGDAEYSTELQSKGLNDEI